VVHHLGSGRRRVLVLGGQHGWPEENTVELAGGLLDFFMARPGELQAGVGLDVMVVANPDGLQIGSRQFISGVDPNRNWGGPDWQPDTYDSNARFRYGLGGPAPFSEQETRALRDWVLGQRPSLIVNYHSLGGFLFGGNSGQDAELTDAYVAASGYYTPSGSGGSGGGGRLLGYRATGSMGVWQRQEGLSGLFIELSTSTDPEYERNLAGLRAVLARLSAAV
jgi:hypothetical protein